ncbi:TPA: hypothetical protein HA265_08585 [Candidatus Woesearchaeota archaeon]|nr:hypothetical protein [Candidatus Woesearchaeota archaeon]
MKRSFIVLFFLSLMLLGCAKPIPKECYRNDIQAMYLCEGGEKITTFRSKTQFELVDIEGTKIMCDGPSNPPCDIYRDNEYCPKIDFCMKPEREAAGEEPAPEAIPPSEEAPVEE